MAQVTTADISKLRQLTGAGMMDCKKALEEAAGDVEKAIEIIRKRGQAIANKRADREAGEGVVFARTTANDTIAAMIILNCETDFVAKNEGFKALANQILDVAIETKPANLDALKSANLGGKTVNDHILGQIAAIGEKVELSYYEKIQAPYISIYIHSNNKLASMVGFSKVVPVQAGKDVAMQVAAMNPVAIDKDDVSKETIQKEIEIGMEQARKEGKPEAMLEKIAQGKLNKFYNESTLLNQEFIKDNKKNIRQYLSETDKDVTVTVFKRKSLTV
jgi:elongation factor Ts